MSQASLPTARRLPTFLVIGANKAGTTSMYRYLGSHPQVFVSSIKEPHFFAYHGQLPPASVPLDTIRSLPPKARGLHTIEDYAALFEGASDRHLAIGEASTGYLCGPLVPQSVRRQIPDVRVVALLRDPAERAWSDFLTMRRLGHETDGSLEHILATRPTSRYVELGRYGVAIERWLAELGPERVRLHLFEDFVSHTRSVVQDVLEFIGVDPDVRPSTRRRYNARRRGEPSLDATTRSALLEILEPDIRHTQTILGRDLSGWLDTPTTQRGIRHWLRRT